jgi:HlyD family secretion protein
MGTATPVSLRVRPYQAAHLCFEVDGILEISTAQLGTTLAAFDFPAFYAILGSMPTVTGDASRLEYDFPVIDAVVAPFALAALRKEPRKAALNTAINARQNAYFAKYANAPAIMAMMNTYYSPSVAESKPNRLAILSGIANDQFSELKAAYTADGRLGVVKNTESVLNSETESTDRTAGSTSQQTQEQGSTDDQSLAAQVDTSNRLVSLPKGGGSLAGKGFTGSLPIDESIGESTSGETSSTTGQDSSTGSGYASEQQVIVNTDYGYRVPYLESAAQFERAQISLMDQQFAQYMYGQNLPNLATVFANELTNIDASVYRLQVAYLNTILMSPIAGTITGIYKNPGEAVRAGEPVVRVEDNSTIYLLATVVYRGPVAIGSTITVNTNLFDQDPGVPTTLTGSVVSVRGHRDDDKWDIVATCDNLNASSEPIFPLGYHFDYDDTTVAIS